MVVATAAVASSASFTASFTTVVTTTFAAAFVSALVSFPRWVALLLCEKSQYRPGVILWHRLLVNVLFWGSRAAKASWGM